MSETPVSFGLNHLLSPRGSAERIWGDFFQMVTGQGYRLEKGAGELLRSFAPS